MEEQGDQLQSIHSQIVGWLERVLSQSPYPFVFNLEKSIEEVLKLYDVKLDFKEENLAERIISFVRVMHEICGKVVFVFVNLKAFLDQATLEELYRSLLYEQVWIIDFENSFKSAIEGEKNTIMDHALCVIHLD